MTRKFTRILAALALLALLALPMGMRGQTRDTKTDIMFAKGFAGYTTGSFSAAGTDRTAVANSTNATGVTYAMQVFNGSTGAVRGNQSGASNYSCRNTTTYDGYYISSVSLTITSTSGGTLDGSTNGRSIVYFGSSAYANPNTTAPSGTATVASPNQSGQTTLTWTNSDEDVSYFILYNLKTSGTVLSESSSSPLTIVWTQKTGPSVTPTTVTIDDTALTNTDVYTSFEAGSLSATVTENTNNTTINDATVTWSSSDPGVATIASDGTVTLVAAGTTTITASYAGESGVYSGSSTTYELTVSDSTPFAGGEITFVAGTDVGTSTGTNPDQITKSGVTVSSTSAALAAAQYRFYKNSVTTISTTSGTITKIVFTHCDNSYPISNLTNIDSNGTWTGSATSVQFTATAQARASKIVVTVVTSGTSAPAISADDVDIAYDAEEGTINYTINNPEDGGSIVASCNAEWIEVDNTPQITSTGSIYFTCYPNSNFYAHSATVTLTYTYDDSKATVTKDITVTQALWPEASGSTAEFPIMVSEAIDAIDEVGTVSNIYVGGIVSSIFEEYSETYHNITFDMIDEEGNEYFLRAYRCGGDEAANVMVGDEVVVYGNLMLFNNSIYEFSSGCQLVSLMHHGEPAITLSSYSIEATAAETEGTLTVTYTEIETSTGVEIHWFESDGVTSASEPDWMTASINTQLNVEYLIEENEGAARTAYFKVYGLDSEANGVYSNLVTVSQAAAPQQYTLTVSELNANIDAIYVYNAADQTNALIADGLAGNAQVLEGTSILVSPVVASGYVLESLTVDGVDVTSQLDASGAYTFTMPSHAVTITATATEYVAPVVGKYVRITSLDDLKDGCKVIIAARYDEEVTDGYYAMPGTASGKPNGVAFTSETSGDDEILPTAITTSEDTYYWIVNKTNNTYTFTNAEGDKIGYGSSTNFGSNGNFDWSITSEESADNALVAEYTGFVITNVNTDTRAFAFNGSVFGAYAKSNMTGTNAKDYNFCLDFFVYTDETHTKNIAGNKWYFIASPTGTVPTNLNSLTDLYYYDEQNHYWRNKKNTANAAGFDFAIGKGYLCANADPTLQNTPETIALTFTGTPVFGDTYVPVTYSPTTSEGDVNTLAGWNLVGNPYGSAATIDIPCYTLRGAMNMASVTAGTTISACEAVMVQATENAYVTFSKVTSGETLQPNQLQLTVAQQVVTRSGMNSVVNDNAIINFNTGSQLEKFAFNEDASKLFIPQNGKDYAIVGAEAQGEMPVSFRAAKNGTYTLTVNPEGVEMNYLHLIDNMTGIDIDLLQTPNYTFEARTTDYTSRFRLVFGANGASADSDSDETFAYFNGSEWMINNSGNATLQVVDVMGRVLSSEAVNGSVSKAINTTAGVYMLRLVSGNDVKTQKIVVR